MNEHELAVLGAMLLDNSVIPDVGAMLEPDMFTSPRAGATFRAIVSVHEGGSAADLLSVSDQPGVDASYVSGLTSQVPSSANWAYYSRTVLTAWQLRELRSLAEEIKEQANGSGSPAELCETIDREVSRLLESGTEGSINQAKDSILEAVEAVEAAYHSKGEYSGIPVGYPDLDGYTDGFQKGDFIIIGARPSQGKTALALSMAQNVAIGGSQRKGVGFISLEMSRSSLMLRLLSSTSNVDSSRLRKGLLAPADFDRMAEASSRIYESNIAIYDRANAPISELKAVARKMKHDGAEIIFIDYVGLITSSNPPANRHEEVSGISRDLKVMARNLDLPVVALCQIRRETEGNRPHLRDLRESGSLEQDADVVVFIHTPDKDQPTHRELILAKQRNGPIGDIPVYFNEATTRFESMVKGDR